MVAMTGQTFDLNEDYNAGLQQAVNNNQPSLALRYLLQKLENLESRIEELEVPEEPVAKSMPSKKTAAKKTATKKPAEEEV